MKKSVLLGCLAATCIAAAPVYAENLLTVEQVVFSDEFFNSLFATEITDFNMTGAVRNNGEEAKSAVVISAVYKEEDMSLVSVNTQELENIAPGSIEPFYGMISVPDTKGYVVNVFVWDSEENGVSLSKTYGLYDRFVSPAAPGELKLDENGYYDLTVSWLEPDHHLGITSYNIYVDGTLAGTSNEESYKITNLKSYGTKYDIEIEAVDESGTVSEKSEVLSAETQKAAYMILEEQTTSYLFDQDIPNSPSFDDGGKFNEIVEAGPEGDIRQCRKIRFEKPYNGNPNGMANYLYFGVDGGYITPDDREVTIMVTCLDAGTDTIGINYKDAGGAEKNITAKKTGSNEWKTFEFHISDAKFANEFSSYYDFRINTGESNTEEYVYKVEVFKGNVTLPVQE